jgi:phosphoglycerate-specific signal transduction histidine kinase
MEEITIRASIDQLEEFKESVLWADIVEELNSWRQGFNSEMLSIVDEAEGTNPSTASVLLHMGDLNGRQKAVDYFLSLPDVFLDLLRERIEAKKGDKKNGPD